MTNWSYRNDCAMPLMEEVEASDVKVRDYRPKRHLNPKLYVRDRLDSRVRLQLLDIADDFVKELSVKWVKPLDIVITGSLANYTWTRHSDIDLHVVMDFSEVYPKNKEFVRDYFDTKRDAWRHAHPDLTIYGFPVELYVEDVAQPPTAAGRYSLEKNEWVSEPSGYDNARLNEPYIQRKCAQIINDTDDMMAAFKSEHDRAAKSKIGTRAKRLYTRLRVQRQAALRRSGELASWNIIYKVLRQAGCLDDLRDMINQTYDISNSIPKEDKSKT